MLLLQPVHIIPLAERFNQKKWERFNSEKICHISYARIQGRSSLISHFQVRREKARLLMWLISLSQPS